MTHNEILDAIISDLRGSACDAEEIAQEYGLDYLTVGDYEYIEKELFYCEGCGWWCDISERNETNDGCYVCDDCIREEEDDND